MGTFHIIDDEANVRDILKNMIDCFGYEAVLFESADAYLEQMNSKSYEPPIAILTDNVMPGTSGSELVDRIYADMPGQKLVMVSGTPGGQQIDSDKLCYTLLKPFRMNELKRLLDSLKKCDLESGEHQYEAACKFGLGNHCPLYSRQ